MGRRAKKLKDHEIRVMRMPRSAIVEIIVETLMERGYKQLNIADDHDENIMLRVALNEDMSDLICYACNTSPEGEKEWERIDCAIRENVGITAGSIYERKKEEKPYVVLSKNECKT